MKISQLIVRLERLKAEQGDIEILREDGKPFTYFLIDEIEPTKNAPWSLNHVEKVNEWTSKISS